MLREIETRANEVELKIKVERDMAIRLFDCYDGFIDADEGVIMGSDVHRMIREWTKPEIELVTKIINDIVDSKVITNFDKGKIEITHEDKFNIFGVKIKDFYQNKKLKNIFVMVAPPYVDANYTGGLTSEFKFTLVGWSEKDENGRKLKYNFIEREVEERLPKSIVNTFMRLWEQLDENKFQILMKNKELGNIYGIDALELNRC